jgi:hypothetical protein
MVGRSGFGEGFWRLKGGWLLRRDLGYWRSEDIAALARFCRHELGRKSVKAIDELNRLARLQVAVPAYLQRSMELGHLRLEIGEWLRWVDGGPATACMRFWHMLKPAQRRDALGKGLLWRSLTEPQERAASSIGRALLVSGYPDGRRQTPVEAVPIVWNSDTIRFQVRAQLTPMMGQFTAQSGSSERVFRPQVAGAPEWIPKWLRDSGQADALATAYAHWKFDFVFDFGYDSLRVAFAMSQTTLWQGKGKDLAPNASKIAALFEPYWKEAAALEPGQVRE